MKFDAVFLKFSEVCSSSDRENWECQISTSLTIIAFTFLLLFGTFGNITSLCVLLRKKMRKLSVSTFVTFLTVSDTINLWITSADYLSQHFYDKSLDQQSMTSCKVMPWLHFNLTSFSLWCIAAFSIHRLTCLKKATTADRSGQKKYQVEGLICLLIVICSLNAPVLFGNILSVEKQTPAKYTQESFTNGSQANIFPADDKNLANRTYEKTLNISQANVLPENLNDSGVENATHVPQIQEQDCIYISKEFEAFMLGMWLPFCIAIYLFLPVIIIVICNIGIAYTVIKSRRTVATFQNTQLNHTQHSGTRILAVISSYTLLTTTVLSFYVLVMSNNKSSYIQPRTYILQIGVAFLGFSSFALNGAFYLWFGSMFRREFLAMLTEAKTAMVSLYRRNRVNPE